MTGADTVRAFGANLRVTILNAYSNFGHATGKRVLRRLAWEIGQNGAEVHGKEAMAELLYQTADDLVAGRDWSDPEPAPTVIDLCEPEPEPEPSPDDEQKVSEGTETPLTDSRAAAKPWSWAAFWCGLGVGVFIIAANGGA